MARLGRSWLPGLDTIVEDMLLVVKGVDSRLPRAAVVTCNMWAVLSEEDCLDIEDEDEVLLLQPDAKDILNIRDEDSEEMNLNPKDPDWNNRDRYVLSSGQRCMLLCFLLLGIGLFSVSMDGIKQLNKLVSKASGHSEFRETVGIEVITGPLGMGILNAVGSAAAEAHLSAVCNTPGRSFINHIYCSMGDGGMREGIHEFGVYASHFGMSKRIAFHGDFSITINGHMDLSFTENLGMRYEAYGWQVLHVKDDNADVDVIREDPEVMNFNSKDLDWINHDCFALSMGHGCMLQFFVLHPTGYFSVSMDDIKLFRQWGFKMSGHSDNFETVGIEAITGALDMGISNVVGLAAVDAHFSAVYNKPGMPRIDHYTHCIMGDGCMQEGSLHEFCAYAGHLGLGQLIAIRDDNGITIDGHTDPPFTESVGRRYVYCMQVLIKDADAIRKAIAKEIAGQKDLDWTNRDRFDLSTGHECMLQYSVPLFIDPFSTSMYDIKRYRLPPGRRAWASRMPWALPQSRPTSRRSTASLACRSSTTSAASWTSVACRRACMLHFLAHHFIGFLSTSMNGIKQYRQWVSEALGHREGLAIRKAGIQVWPSFDVSEFVGAKDALSKFANASMGLADTMAHFSETAFAEGFKLTKAFQPRVIEQNRSSSGECIWIIELKSSDYDQHGTIFEVIQDFEAFIVHCSPGLFKSDGGTSASLRPACVRSVRLGSRSGTGAMGMDISDAVGLTAVEEHLLAVYCEPGCRSSSASSASWRRE